MVSGQYSDVLARGRSIQENMKAHQHHSLLYGPHKMGEVLKFSPLTKQPINNILSWIKRISFAAWQYINNDILALIQ
jgi:hypothetical protein